MANIMIQYAAFLRGIMPMNPNMRNEKLRAVFESLGYAGVATVVASGNVVFESQERNSEKLEGSIEKEIAKKLGFTCTVIIRSLDELRSLIEVNPYKNHIDSAIRKLNLTFLKHRDDHPHDVVFTIVNLESEKSPEIMKALEKTYGKAVTTRTWNTVLRVLALSERLKKDRLTA